MGKHIRIFLLLSFAFIIAVYGSNSLRGCLGIKPNIPDPSTLQTEELVDRIAIESVSSNIFEYLQPEIISRGDEALPFLKEHLQSDNYLTKEAPVYLLGKLNTDKSIDLLLPLFEHPRLADDAFRSVMHSGRERVYQALKQVEEKKLSYYARLALLRALHYHSESGNYQYLEKIANDFVNANNPGKKNVLRHYLKRMMDCSFQTEKELFLCIQKLKGRQENDKK